MHETVDLGFPLRKIGNPPSITLVQYQESRLPAAGESEPNIIQDI